MPRSSNESMETFQIRLPDAVEREIQSVLKRSRIHTNRSEFIRDAVRRYLIELRKAKYIS